MTTTTSDSSAGDNTNRGEAHLGQNQGQDSTTSTGSSPTQAGPQDNPLPGQPPAASNTPKTANGRRKGARPLTPELREKKRQAGIIRGEQLKQDTQHQSKAGQARAARGDMSEIGQKGRKNRAAKRSTHEGTDAASSDGGAATLSRNQDKAGTDATGSGQPDSQTPDPQPGKKVKPTLSREELSERGRKGQQAALAKHPDLYERAGQASRKAQEAGRKQKENRAGIEQPNQGSQD